MRRHDIVTSLLGPDLERAGLDPRDTVEVQAFGLWLRSDPKAQTPLEHGYASSHITAREYLTGLALERLP